MLSRIRALNEESSEESDSDEEKEPTITREALEELAVKEYTRALQLKGIGKIDAALLLMKDLLETDLLTTVQIPEIQDNVDRPMLKLKYSCHRNVALICQENGDEQTALQHYGLACELDGTDCHLWYKFGTLAMKLNKFVLAHYAFDKAVQYNPHHWPSMDSLIQILFVTNNYGPCLHYISKALKKESGYSRGHAIKEFIFEERSFLEEYFEDLEFPENTCLDETEKSKFWNETQDLVDRWIEQCKEPPEQKSIPIPAFGDGNYTWLSLGNVLLKVYKFVMENKIYIATINLPNVLATKSQSLEDMEVEENPENEATPLRKSSTEEDLSSDQTDKGIDHPNGLSTEDNIASDNAKSGDENATSSSEKRVIFDVTDKSKDKIKEPKRRRGSDLARLEQWGWSKQRKSSRKKGSEKEKYSGDECIEDALKRIIPQYLFPLGNFKLYHHKSHLVGDMENSLDTMDLYRLFDPTDENRPEYNSNSLRNNDIASTEQVKEFCDKEESAVKDFIDKYTKEPQDIVILLMKWLYCLSDQINILWPQGLTDLYLDIYKCFREVFAEHPSVFLENNKLLAKDAKISLLYLQLMMDKCLQTLKDNNDFSSGHSGLESKFFLEDMIHIDLISWREDLFPNDFLEHYIKVQWVRCHYYLNQRQTQDAIERLQCIILRIKEDAPKPDDFKIDLVNCKINKTVTLNVAESLLKNLERTESLCSIENLYESKDYKQIADTLKEALKQGQSITAHYENSISKESTLPRPTLIHILLESLWATERYKECLTWSEICLYEACQHYLTGIGGYQQEWGEAINCGLIYIDSLMKLEDPLEPLKCLVEHQQTRLVQSLTNLIIHQVDDKSPGMQTQTATVVDLVKPWIILYYIIFLEEIRGKCGRKGKLRAGYSKIVVEEEINGIVRNYEDDDEDDFTLATKLLFTAHEFLGRRHLCCASNGALLLFILENVAKYVKYDPSQEVLLEYLEQCCFCLYGHPSKKSKPRYLLDHEVQPINLTWKYAQLIYEIYRPNDLPEFDSYRLVSINTETEILFQRLVQLVPLENNPLTNVAAVKAFIYGTKDVLLTKCFNLPYQISNIYYLIGDYYLKCRDFRKALKHYTLDICLYPKRIDSWAGMALARATQLETKLNSCEDFRNENEFLDKSRATICCFEQALEIDPNHSLLLIEFGNFVYAVHSNCSRMLKQASDTLSMEKFEVLETRKDTMLETAYNCFTKANQVWQGAVDEQQDERWLHHYMLGKVSEKKKDDPQIYLEHYLKAHKFLFENNATYPKKINYNAPPHLAVEALEVFYRVSACIIKYFEQHNHKAISRKLGKLFLKYLKETEIESLGGDPPTPKPAEKSLVEDETEKAEFTKPDSTSEIETTPQDASVKRKSDDIDENVAKKQRIEGESEVLVISDSDPLNKSTTSSDKNMTAEIVAEENLEVENAAEFIEKPSVAELMDVEMESTAVEEEPAKLNLNSEDVTNSEMDCPPPLPAISTESSTSTTTSGSEAASETNTRTSSRNNSSSSDSSSSDSSSDDSSSDDSSTDSSDTKSVDSKSSKTSKGSKTKSLKKQEDKFLTNTEISDIIKKCVNNLEECVKRFPQHYKAIYRLGYHYLNHYNMANTKTPEGAVLCKELLLSSHERAPGDVLNGLFFERKSCNFFNGVWRIPASEVDRPGSFCAHMSRCVMLLMEVLRESSDHKMLLELSLQLQRTPDSDKMFLRESERKELSKQATTLCLQALKSQLQKIKDSEDPNIILIFMLELYKIYRKVQKNIIAKEKAFATLLTDVYKMYMKNKINPDSIYLIDMATKFCQQQLNAKKQQLQQQIILGNTDPSQLKPTTSAPYQVGVTRPNLPAPPTTTTTVPQITQSILQPPLATTPKRGRPAGIGGYSKSNPALKSATPYSMMNSYLSMLPMFTDPTMLNAMQGKFDMQTSAALNFLSSMNSLTSSTIGGLPTPSLYGQYPYPTDSYTSSAMMNYAELFKKMSPASNQKLPEATSKYTSSKRNHLNTNLVAQQAPKPAKRSNKNATYKQPASTTTKPVTFKDPKSVNYPKDSLDMASKFKETKAMNYLKDRPNTTITPVSMPPTSTYLSTHQKLPASTSISAVKPAHIVSASNISSTTASITKPPPPHVQSSPGKTLQQKLAERQLSSSKNQQVSDKISKNLLLSEQLAQLSVKKSSMQELTAEQAKYLPRGISLDSIMSPQKSKSSKRPKTQDFLGDLMKSLPKAPIYDHMAEINKVHSKNPFDLSITTKTSMASKNINFAEYKKQTDDTSKLSKSQNKYLQEAMGGIPNLPASLTLTKTVMSSTSTTKNTATESKSSTPPVSSPKATSKLISFRKNSTSSNNPTPPISEPSHSSLSVIPQSSADKAQPKPSSTSSTSKVEVIVIDDD